jgi:DNA-binding LacI/PurR family transcriptional regulator
MLSVPTITSIHQPLEDAASSACDRIVELTGSMEHLDNQPQQRLLLPRLVERGSTYMEESI